MRICIIGGIYSPGGARKNFLKITPETTLENGLREAGHHVTTLSHYDHADFSRFDVVHVHHLSYGAIRMAGDLSRTPFVFTAHDSSRMNGHPQGGLQRAAVPLVLSRADAIVALSHREAAFLENHYPLRGARMAVIPNGIDPSHYTFRRTNTAGQDAPWRLLFAGQLIPLKGVDLLLRAVALRPENIRLTLAYQTAQMESDLRALATGLGIAGRVDFAGKLDPRALAGCYHSHDLLVLPSATEALPSVITEAMLCGLPFIATATGGIPEQSAGFGHLLHRRTPEDLATAIGEVLGNYARYAAQGVAMSDSARQRFSIDNMLHRHLALYSGVVHSGTAPRRQSPRFALMNAVARLAARRRAVPVEIEPAVGARFTTDN